MARGFWRRKADRAEDRAVTLQSFSATSRVSGSSAAGRPQFLAAAQAVGGHLSRAVASARVDAPPVFRNLITPRLLSWASRTMLFCGQAAIWLAYGTRSNNPDRLALIPATSSWINPTTLDLFVYEPGGSRSLIATLDEVALPFWETDLSNPWRGTSPLLARSQGEVGLAADTLAMCNREILSQHGFVLYVEPKGTHDGNIGASEVDRTKDAVEASTILAGRGQLDVFVGGSVMGGPSDRRRGETTRYGPDFPDNIINLMKQGFSQVAAALGLDPVLLSDVVESQNGYRHFLAAVAQPVASNIAAELSRVLEVEVGIDVSPTRTADDIQGRARAVNSLVSAGITQKDALRIAGLPYEDVGLAEPVIPVQTGTNNALPASTPQT